MDLPDSNKPSVLRVVDSDNLIRIDGSDSLIGKWLKAAEAQNSIDGMTNLKNIIVEENIQPNPDIIQRHKSQERHREDQE